MTTTTPIDSESLEQQAIAELEGRASHGGEESGYCQPSDPIPLWPPGHVMLAL